MGLSSSTFTSEELDEYTELTYFSKGEIIELFKQFSSLLSEREDGKKVRVAKERMLEFELIKHNPFAERLCDIFSTDGDGSISFDDFLDMMNALCVNADFKLKAQYAFHVFDMNGNGFVDGDDVATIIRMLTKNEESIEDSMITELIESIMDEADLDGDGQLSVAEFEHILSKAPDFMNAFRIQV